MQRMDRENGRGECARPERARHLLKRKKQQNRPGAVQQHIDKMMPSRLESKELAVQHVRHRCERVPVLRMNMRECPKNAVPT